MLHKSALFSFLFSVCFLAGAAQEKNAIDSSYSNSHYRQRLAFFRQMPDSKKEIVFLGNSITEAGEWQELVSGKNVKNRGISGDVTYGVLARLDEVLSSKPSKIFLLIGINDLKRGIPADTIISNYMRIIEKIKAASPKTKLYIQSVLPVNESMLGESYKKITNKKIVALNAGLVQLAMQTHSIYADVHSIMQDEVGQLKKDRTTDGIHLQSAAYIYWVKYLKDQKYL